MKMQTALQLQADGNVFAIKVSIWQFYSFRQNFESEERKNGEQET